MFLFKKDLSLITRRLSFNSNTNFLFSFDSTLKFSKDGEWLQSNKWSLTTLPSSLTFFLVNGEISICSPILAHSLTAEITLKFINDIRCKFYRNAIFNTKSVFCGADQFIIIIIIIITIITNLFRPSNTIRSNLQQ